MFTFPFADLNIVYFDIIFNSNIHLRPANSQKPTATPHKIEKFRKKAVPKAFAANFGPLFCEICLKNPRFAPKTPKNSGKHTIPSPVKAISTYNCLP